MSLDGKILRDAISSLQERRAAREAELNRRRSKVYSELPRVRQIDQELRDTMLGVVARALKKGGDPASELEAIQSRNLSLQEERARVLRGGGYPSNYIDDNPKCDKCGDTGFHMGRRCSCLMDIYKKLQSEELSSLLKLGEETFESFSLECYDNIKLVKGETAREIMKSNFDICHTYANKFGDTSRNLLLVGGTGLGKTFLSTCIAKVVSEKGYSVVYDTAGGIFSKFEEEKFHRAYDEYSDSGTERYLKTDLLIMDDLGTEMITTFTVSTLYNLINSRLISGEKTIISSNLSTAEMREKYSGQIMSRLEGEYILLPFYGDDIRRMKSDM